MYFTSVSSQYGAHDAQREFSIISLVKISQKDHLKTQNHVIQRQVQEFAKGGAGVVFKEEIDCSKA